MHEWTKFGDHGRADVEDLAKSLKAKTRWGKDQQKVTIVKQPGIGVARFGIGRP